jgi:hypothetical protein
MTAQEMQYRFELMIHEFHKVDKTFTSTDVAGFLNRAVEIIVSEKYSNKKGLPYISFESDEKTRIELGSLIKNYKATSGFVTSDEALHPMVFLFLFLQITCIQ